MKLSAPIYRLKHQAKRLSRETGVPLHEALDRVASQEGFASWSLLVARCGEPAQRLFGQLSPGDMVLVAGRPGQGKTRLCLEVARQAERSWLFSLEYTRRDVDALVASPPAGFSFDGSDDLCAQSIVQKLEDAPSGTVAVVDYLQVLDQRRENPPLEEQVRAMRDFAKRSGVIFVFVSQIDRSFDPQRKRVPDLADVRLPNPLDLRLFDRRCFLHGGNCRID